MRALAWVWLAGTLLILVSTAVRSAKETPRRSPPRLVTVPPTEETSLLEDAAMADPGSDAQVELPSEGVLLAEQDSASEPTQDLVVAIETDPRNDPFHQLTASWGAWRKQAIAALPEHLREDSDHRRGIDETYRAAIANLGGPDRAVASDRSVILALQTKVQSVRARASFALLQAADSSATQPTAAGVATLLIRLAEPAEVPNDEFDNSLNSRPPVGGYDVGGIGFEAIDAEVASVVTRESAVQGTYDLRAQTFHTLLRIDPLSRAGIDPLTEKLFAQKP